MTGQLELQDYRRYGRQMILDGIGLPGQLKLQDSSVVVVGAGGLGCPALQYLAAAGIGRIGIIDHDVVEMSNLQRQILHNEQSVGTPKAESAARAINNLNSRVTVESVCEALVPSNAVRLLKSYDIILDCTDNAPTRYLLNDTAVFLGKPLVSGAAQKFEGQLCTYNLGIDGPCYRCMFPKPPAPETVGTCEETGILGAVTGIIGNMQALEAVKILTGLNEPRPSLLLFSALSMPPFRSIKIRSRKATCPACGKEGERVGEIKNIDYVQFCGGERPNWEERGLSTGPARVKVQEFRDALESDSRSIIIDVRPRTEFGICHLQGSINVPIKDLVANPKEHLSADASCIYVVCRLGNDSQIAADALRDLGTNVPIRDVIGGLRAWSNVIDANFPVY